MYFKVKTKIGDDSQYLETDADGYDLINNPRWNKGTAFSQEERDAFNLHGIIPPQQLTLDEAVAKRYDSLVNKTTDLEKHIYLRQIQDRNETLFYALIDRHIEECMPLVYTPVVGEACQKFSQIYRKARGVFVSYPHRDKIDSMLSSSYFDDVAVIVVSDGERILGLGDQGVGGMGIPIGKLSLYTACAGIAPEKTLPILLDVGTDNEELLNNPVYVGWRHKRIRGKEYDEFIEMFIQAVKRRFPHILLQWEDFAQANALKLLQNYRNDLCSFNDDIQGTAAVAVGAIIAAIKASGLDIMAQRIVVMGAGSAGVGISNLLVEYLKLCGIKQDDAYSQIFLVDKNGLISERVECLDFQQPFAKSDNILDCWQVKDGSNISLLETITNANATILIGVCGQPGIFNETIIKQMAKNCSHPVIFPLSNPTNRAEAKPIDILGWTNQQAIVGTGSPFPPFNKGGKMMRVDQVNNCYIFPGIGLGVIVTKTTTISNQVFLAAAIALAELSPIISDIKNNLLPPLSQIKEVSKHIALAVAKTIINEGTTKIDKLSALDDKQLLAIIEGYMWQPKYIPYTLCL